MYRNLDDNDIDIDERTLFNYVSELDAIEDLIKYTPPKYPKRFGKMTEQFKINDEPDTTGGFIVAIIIVAILVFIICGVIYSGSCASYTQMMPDLDNVRPIFVRN